MGFYYTCMLKISVPDDFVEPLVGPTDSSTSAYLDGSQNFLGAFMDIIILLHSSPFNPGSILAVSTYGKEIQQLFTSCLLP